MKLRPCINIKIELDIVSARQLGRNIAKEVGFGTVDQARIATAVSELARNIYLYADSGKICFEPLEYINKKGVRMIASDEGAGIDNISQVMRDGYTTSGGLGAGLPGVRRLMDEFDIETESGKGTTIEAAKWVL